MSYVTIATIGMVTAPQPATVKETGLQCITQVVNGIVFKQVTVNNRT